MEKIECTIYDCEFNQYLKAVLKDNIVYVLDDEEKEVPAKEYVCEYVDYGMVQFYIGTYSQSGVESEDDDCKWGYFLHSTGEVVIPPIYDYAYPFYGEYAKVIKDKKCGCIDYESKEVISIIWDDIDTSLYRGICWIKKGNRFGYVNSLGEIVISPQFEMVRKFWSIDIDYNEKKSYAPVKLNDKWGFIDNEGNLIIDFQFDDIGNEGLLFIDKNINEGIEMFGRRYINYYTVKKEGKWGILKGDLEVIMPEYGQNYVLYRQSKIYIENGSITSINK